MTNLVALVALSLATPLARFDKDVLAQSVYDTAFNEAVRLDRAQDAAWTACATPASLAARQAEVRAKTIAALGGFPEKTPLNAQVTGRVQKEGYILEKVLMETRPHHYMTAHLFLPDPAKYMPPYAAVAVPCGHSLAGKNAPWYQRAGVTGALNGLATLVCDPIEQGERRQFDDGKDTWSTTREHNRIGYRAALLGWNTAQFRIWDGMRAVDYLESRPEVDREKIGVMGLSGGGTLSSYANSLEMRFKAAAPAGFLSTMRDVFDNCGPQDAEQVVFGQLKSGWNHLGIVVLRAPSPVMIVTSHADFFPFMGSTALYAEAKKVYAMLGVPEKVELMETAGPHHWYESTRHASCYWMRRWMLHEETAWPRDRAALRRMDIGYKHSAETCGVAYEEPAVKNVTKTGRTLDLPGSRTVYDLMRDELARLDTARAPLTVEAVRAACGARPLASLSATAAAVQETSAADGRVVTAVLCRDDDMTFIPVRAFLPAGRKDNPVILFNDAGAKALAKKAKEFLSAGRAVCVAEMRSFAETGKTRHKFYGSVAGDEETAVVLRAIGENLVARRAEDAALAARWFAALCGGDRPELYVEGRAAIPAAHAKFLEKETFAGFAVEQSPASWRQLLADPTIESRFADLVNGALRVYDWTDL